jgi:RNA polymerase sigma-70 factor (ECF subfamily)
VSQEKISPRDARELQECFRSNAGDLFGYAYVVARGDRELADDLVQAAFEAAAGAWHLLRGLAAEQRKCWLQRTVTYTAVTRFRREAAFRDLLPRLEARYRKIPADPGEQAFSLIVLERCWRIIQAMPDRQHAVALLRWQLDMKLGEIAVVLGMAEKTVSAHLHRARRKLIAQLGPDYPFTGGDQEGASP